MNSMLFQELNAAWDTLIPPSFCNIVVATTDEEGTSKIFYGQKWKHVSVEEICEHPTTLWFLTNDAFIYYLPSILRAIDGGGRDTVLWGHFLAQFGREEREAAVFSMLSKNQRKVMAEYLKIAAGDIADTQERTLIAKLEATE